jgi:Hypervirulence associated proteins TUDOR domain
MVKTFKVGDHVSWNSEAGRVRGKIVKVHRRAVNYKGHVHVPPRKSRSMRSRATRPTTSPCTRPRF